MRLFGIRSAAMLTIGLAGCVLAQAGPIYISDSAGELATVSTAGVVHIIGTARYPSGAPILFGDIAVSAAGKVYGSDYGNGDDLYEVSTVDASPTKIGNSGLAYWGMTFGSNGTLYAADAGALYSVNVGTGALTLIGLNGATLAGDIEFVGGKMYETATDGYLYEINTSTGISTKIGNGTLDPTIYGLAYQGGVLYGFNYYGHMLSIDVTNGTATDLGTLTGDGLEGYILGASTAPSAVPEPATLTLALALGAGLIRRRRAAR